MGALDAERYLAALRRPPDGRRSRTAPGLADTAASLGRWPSGSTCSTRPPEELRRAAAARTSTTRALEQLLAPRKHDDEPRPTLEGHGNYVFGVFLVPVLVPNEDRVFYQEVDVVGTRERPASPSARHRTAASTRSTLGRRSAACRPDDGRRDDRSTASSTRSPSATSTCRRAGRRDRRARGQRRGLAAGADTRPALASCGTTSSTSGARSSPTRDAVRARRRRRRRASTTAGRVLPRRRRAGLRRRLRQAPARRATGSSCRAICSRASATTCRRRSRTTRTR